ncbi:cell wall protein Ecm33 [Entomophthora muscae]|uniref:Cell wall protein Ecm33 n=1 Tax=Entomophthora muscae TaxID=34485 RepID=A0ACC2SYK1_9FUNG|nr:cell wall protein Ecm33 [Entomophthora muscae]
MRKFILQLFIAYSIAQEVKGCQPYSNIDDIPKACHRYDANLTIKTNTIWPENLELQYIKTLVIASSNIPVFKKVVIVDSLEIVGQIDGYVNIKNILAHSLYIHTQGSAKFDFSYISPIHLKLNASKAIISGIDSRYLSSLELLAIHNEMCLSKIQQVMDITLYYAPSNLEILLPNLSRVDNLNIKDPQLVTFESNFKEVSGNILFEHTKQLKSVYFPSLEKLGGSLYISGATELNYVSIPRLTKVKSLEIECVKGYINIPIAFNSSIDLVSRINYSCLKKRSKRLNPYDHIVHKPYTDMCFDKVVLTPENLVQFKKCIFSHGLTIDGSLMNTELEFPLLQEVINYICLKDYKHQVKFPALKRIDGTLKIKGDSVLYKNTFSRVEALSLIIKGNIQPDELNITDCKFSSRIDIVGSNLKQIYLKTAKSLKEIHVFHNPFLSKLLIPNLTKVKLLSIVDNSPHLDIKKTFHNMGQTKCSILNLSFYKGYCYSFMLSSDHHSSITNNPKYPQKSFPEDNYFSAGVSMYGNPFIEDKSHTICCII